MFLTRISDLDRVLQMYGTLVQSFHWEWLKACLASQVAQQAHGPGFPSATPRRWLVTHPRIPGTDVHITCLSAQEAVACRYQSDFACFPKYHEVG